ncbi:MAG: sulfurtransferase [Gammaproteobacteria bacterium]|nr:sulfurtransferase [Gammaproteobacteria bacterium]
MIFDTLITAEQLASRIDQPDGLIFDCRFDLADVEKGHAAYLESHIPGAIYAHLDHHLSGPITPLSGRHPLPDMRELAHWLQQQGMTSSRQVVVYDDSFGAMAARLWWLLKCLGHHAVALLDGGWQAWTAAGYTIDNQVIQPEAGSFDASFNRSCVVSSEQVLHNLENQEFCLVDVRASERFKGIHEPIDPVAGHIPHSCNLPLTHNLDDQGFFKSAQELRAIYKEINEKCSPKQQVYMCGSGVTACHSLVALSVAGFDRPRIYAGSWSEWIRDPSRPIIMHQPE